MAGTSTTTGLDAGREALRHLDAILSKQPVADSQLFSDCTQCLTVLRGDLTRRAASDADRTSLAHVNAVISVVLAGRFPLGPVPWDELQKARDWLAAVVG